MLNDQLPASVRERYDLIGFDPRGVGLSSPLTCGLSGTEAQWPRVYRAKTYAKDVATAKRVADKCRKKSGDKLSHITIRNTARDMDLIRSVLGGVCPARRLPSRTSAARGPHGQ